MRILTSILFFLLLVSCGSDQTSESNESSEELAIEDSTSAVEEIEVENQDEILCFDGTIDGKYNIYLEYMISYEREDCSAIEGFYYYTSNNIGFVLTGEICGDEITLNRLEDDEIAETFTWIQGENFGSWTMDGSSKDLELNRTKPYSEKSEEFLEACQEINSQYENYSVTAIDYSKLNKLSYENSIFVEEQEFYMEYCGNKIYLTGSYESSAGGHSCTATYALLDASNNSGDTQLMHFEMMNAWTNDYHDMEIDEDDEYVLDPNYWAFLNTYSYSDGKLQQNQSIEFSGEGEANAYFFNERLIIEGEAEKDILIYSPEKKVFVEQ